MSADDWRGYIDITEVPLARLVAEAFSLSVPMGRGYEAVFMKSLSEEDAMRSVERGHNLATVDYIHGRAVKLLVKFDCKTGRTYLPINWPMHSREQLHTLLERVGFPDAGLAVLNALEDAREREAQDAARRRGIEIAVLLELAQRMGRNRDDRVAVDPKSTWGLVAMPHLLAAVRKGWADTEDFQSCSLSDAGRQVCADAVKNRRYRR